MKRVYTLTPSEAEIVKNSSDDPNIFADYWFRPHGTDKGWTFDDNFTEDGKWQRTVHEAAQTDIIVIGGFGTGKTIGIGMSGMVWAATTPYFKFLNVAEKAWQAKQMYDYVLQTVAGTPFEKLIYEKPRRPFPAIIIKYKIGNTLVESSLEFMSADKDATGILSWEGDWINVEEAGLLDNLEEIITSVGTRLRGSIRGRSRLGRLSLISNSWDNPYLWYLFDLAEADPDNYLSLVVSTRQNKNVTPQQFAKMLARIPVDERERFIEGTRPEGRGNYFAKQCVFACEDQLQGELAQREADLGTPGYVVYKMLGAGVFWYQEPPRKNHIYFMLGDPGAGKAPNRNAPVIGVWDVTQFPGEAARMVAFWWGDGNNQITPFVDKLLELDQTYRPALKACDATGPQKNTHELINIQHFDSPDMPVSTLNKVIGLDFSGGHKMAYLIAARLFIEAGLLKWPKSIVGVRSQLTNYDPLKDKVGKPKIPQDIVSMFSMAAHIMRIYFNVEISTLAVSDTLEPEPDPDAYRRRSGEERSRRSTHRDREGFAE
jgi:hypothetical protein